MTFKNLISVSVTSFVLAVIFALTPRSVGDDKCGSFLAPEKSVSPECVIATSAFGEVALILVALGDYYWRVGICEVCY